MNPLPGDVQTDKALVDRCVKGEAGARETFAASYAPVIRKAVWQVMGPGPSASTDVENTVQQIFLDLLRDGARKLGTFDGRSRLTTWLTVVATRDTLNAVAADPSRRLDRAMGRGLAQALAHRAGKPPSPLDEMAREEERAHVREVLDRMNARDRLLLTIVREEGASYAEAARILGISPNSIGSLLERAESRFLDLASRIAPGLVLPRDED